MTRITFGVMSKGPENGSPPEGEGEQKEAAEAICPPRIEELRPQPTIKLYEKPGKKQMHHRRNAAMQATPTGPVHPTALPPGELLKQTSEARTRRSGPGGQHRNKTETAVILVHEPTGISAEASERRSQAENRKVAVGRLRMKLALEHRSPAGSAGPSALWRSRTSGRKLMISVEHDDYPALVAEALDRLQVSRFEIAPAAEQLGVSTSQLVRLFKKSPAAWVALNHFRSAAGLPGLK